MSVVIYLLDQIPFKNYNVYVSDSSNLFDKASIKENQKKDWSDEHGYDIDLQSRYHNSKTITIDCFITANSLKECIEKYNDFFNALDKKGSRRLSVIAGDLRMEYQVFRQDTAENKLIYDDSNAAGTFKLKLIENMPVKRILKSYNQPFIKLFQDFYEEYLKGISYVGRNFVLKSTQKFLYIYTPTDDYFEYNMVMLEANTQYTISYDYAFDSTCKGMDVYIAYKNPDKIVYYKQLEPTNGDWGQKQIAQFTTDTNVSELIKVFIYNNGSIDGERAGVTIKNLKIEKGNKATDWTQAPEDVKLEAIEKLESISNDNYINESDKNVLKNEFFKINNIYSNLLNNSHLKQIYYDLKNYVDFIINNQNDVIINSKSITINLKSKKILVINWGDGTEQYTSPDNEVYSHRYSNNEIYFPMILGDLDSITTFNSNADVLWNRF